MTLELQHYSEPLTVLPETDREGTEREREELQRLLATKAAILVQANQEYNDAVILNIENKKEEFLQHLLAKRTVAMVQANQEYLEVIELINENNNLILDRPLSPEKKAEEEARLAERFQPPGHLSGDHNHSLDL